MKNLLINNLKVCRTKRSGHNEFNTKEQFYTNQTFLTNFEIMAYSVCAVEADYKYKLFLILKHH